MLLALYRSTYYSLHDIDALNSFSPDLWEAGLTERLALCDPLRFVVSRRSARRPLRLVPAAVQNPLGIPVRLPLSLEDQVAGGIEGGTVKAWSHRSIFGISRILPVDNLGHPPQRPQYLLLVDYAVMQPVGDVLA